MSRMIRVWEDMPDSPRDNVAVDSTAYYEVCEEVYNTIRKRAIQDTVERIKNELPVLLPDNFNPVQSVLLAIDYIEHRMTKK